MPRAVSFQPSALSYAWTELLKHVDSVDSLKCERCERFYFKLVFIDDAPAFSGAIFFVARIFIIKS